MQTSAQVLAYIGHLREVTATFLPHPLPYLFGSIVRLPPTGYGVLQFKAVEFKEPGLGFRIACMIHYDYYGQVSIDHLQLAGLGPDSLCDLGIVFLGFSLRTGVTSRSSGKTAGSGTAGTAGKGGIVSSPLPADSRQQAFNAGVATLRTDHQIPVISNQVLEFMGAF